MKPVKPLKVTEIERMSTHQLADLLANIVLVLRRLPDVAMIDLQPVKEPPSIIDELLASSQELPDWMKEPNKTEEYEVGQE